jgi:hypothetical protein
MNRVSSMGDLIKLPNNLASRILELELLVE